MEFFLFNLILQFTKIFSENYLRLQVEIFRINNIIRRENNFLRRIFYGGAKYDCLFNSRTFDQSF